MSAALLIAGCSQDAGAGAGKSTAPDAAKPTADAGPKKTIAFVANNSEIFWTIAKKGTAKAEAELKGYTVDFRMTDGTTPDQKRILDDLVAKGVAGIAVSPKDAKSQEADLNAIADKMPLVTQDSDAPSTKRACYIGTDNIAAGKSAGEELKKALPNGGKVMVFVGDKGAPNAKERYQGLQEAVKGTKITIIDIRTDDGDKPRAKQNVSDTLVKYPDVAGLVGLWGYNGPMIAAAVKEADKVGKVKIVCFDDEPDTLAGVKDGTISSTIVQQPYEFGYQAVKLLAKLIEGDKSVVPANKTIIVDTKVVDKSNVDEYATKLKELTG